jgi:predicted DNA-binding transcriptional regulator YafY
MNLSRREVFSFSLARKMLHAFEGTPLQMDMRSTLDKIAGSLEGTFAVSLDALTEHMSVQAEDRVVIDPAIWEAVARAIERRDILRADYRRFDGRRGSYEIEPLHLLAYHGNWYGLARSRGSDKTFALSRFGKVVPTGKCFKRPAGFEWRAFSREAFGLAHGEKPGRIRLGTGLRAMKRRGAVALPVVDVAAAHGKLTPARPRRGRRRTRDRPHRRNRSWRRSHPA